MKKDGVYGGEESLFPSLGCSFLPIFSCQPAERLTPGNFISPQGNPNMCHQVWLFLKIMTQSIFNVDLVLVGSIRLQVPRKWLICLSTCQMLGCIPSNPICLNLALIPPSSWQPYWGCSCQPQETDALLIILTEGKTDYAPVPQGQVTLRKLRG